MRALGRLPAMGVPESFVARHPFPGPGLGVRIIGDVTQDDHLDVLRQVGPPVRSGLIRMTVMLLPSQAVWAHPISWTPVI